MLSFLLDSCTGWQLYYNSVCDSCTGWQLHVNEGYTELPTQGVGDLLGGSFIDNPKEKIKKNIANLRFFKYKKH